MSPIGNSTHRGESQSPKGGFAGGLLNRLRSLLELWPNIPAGLCDEENEIYNMLTEAGKGRSPPHLVVITDLAKDYDDLMAMVLLAELHHLGLVVLEAFVANLMPAEKRARFGRGALDLLGLKEIPIAVGSKGSEEEHKVLKHEFKYCSFMAPRSTKFETGEELLLRVFQKAQKEKRKITPVLLSSPKDICEFIDKHSNLFESVVDRISMQGGMYFDEGTFKADHLAANNNFDLDSANKFTKYIQDKNIPTTVFTKVSAFETKIYPLFSAELANTRHPLGIYLKKTQAAQGVQFYRDTKREKTRHRSFMTQRWFIEKRTTLDPEVKPYPRGKKIVPYLTVVAYDALAALGAIHKDVLTELNVLTCADNPTCRIVGEGEDPGINGKRMADIIKALMKRSLLRTGNITSTSRSGILELLSLRVKV